VNKLNSRQLQAVKSISHPTLVLAGAGSGKTSVITRKIAYLINDCGIKAHHIAAVTFTNKAAKEMKARVGQLLPSKDSRGLVVSTFHTLGLNIIRSELPRLGLRPGFSIFDAEDAQSLLRELAIQSGDIDNDLIDFVKHTISTLKNDNVSPEQAVQQASDPQERLISALYLRYQQALTAYNAVDFDDLITLPVRLFHEHPEVLERWQRKIHYLLVDEYQDTNTSQYELVKLLVGHRNGLTVVGDDDQSIYAWRGARPENLMQLQTDFPQLEIIKLEQNYRSTCIILNAANTLISNNPHTIEKKLWSDLSLGDPIRVIKTPNDLAEAERIAQEIISHRLRNNSKYSDYAILYRGNHQARIIEMTLQQENLPYQMSGGTSFFARSEVKDIMAYLRLLANPADDNALLRIINVPRRKIGTSTLQTLASFAKTRNTSLFDAIDDVTLGNELGASALQHLTEFYQWMQNLMRLIDEGNPINAIREMVDDIGYEAWLHQNSSSSIAAEKRMQNVWFLIENLQKALEREQEDNDEAHIKDAISRLILRDIMERQEEEEETDSIQLSTLHASKGLEYPHVYIIGMEEELLPHRTSIEEDTIEEERRLAYVGITRARRNLTLSYASKRKQFGEVLNTTHSRFLDELPFDDLHWEGHSENTPEMSEKIATDTLRGLKSLFDDL
jgi:ATP-dependent DNA helicase Rep